MKDASQVPRRPAALVFLLGLFAAGVGGAWAWFHVGTPERGISWEFAPRPNVDGYRFQDTPLSAKEEEVLASTNLLSGTFTNETGRRFMVFFGDWQARSAREMNVVAHTPDICWVGAGWTPVALDLPSTFELELAGQKVPFECRGFRPPNAQQVELAVWCTVVSGKVFAEGERFATELDVKAGARARRDVAGRRKARDQFLQVLRDRIPGDSTKQFVRYSTTVRGSPERSLEDLKRFGEAWLELRATPPTRATNSPPSS